MQIHSDAIIPFSRETVYNAYRDEMSAMVKFLPNVQAIDVRERVDNGDVVKLVNYWKGGGDVPAAVRSVLKDEMLSWLDHAIWTKSEWSCQWRVEHLSFKDAVNCSGKNRFVEVSAESTRLEIRGDIAIDLKPVKLVPSFMAGTVGKAVEQFMVKQITANLLSVADGLTKYLKSKAS